MIGARLPPEHGGRGRCRTWAKRPVGAVPTGPQTQDCRSATVLIVSGTIDTSRSASGTTAGRRRGVGRRDPGDRRPPVGRRRPAGHRRRGSAARRGALRGAGHRRPGWRDRAIHHVRDRRGDTSRDRFAAARAWLPGPDHPREPRVPDPRHRGRPAAPRLPAESPADAQLPRRPGHGPGAHRSATST